MIPAVQLAAHDQIRDLPTEEQVQRLDVVQEALTWLGTPYHHMGRVKGAAVDCGMLLMEIYETTGVLPHIEVPFYPHDWHMHRSEPLYLGAVKEHAQPVEVPRPGDIAVFQYGRCVSHGAIVLVWPEIIHAYVGLGVVLDNCETNQDLGERLVGFYSPWGE